MGNTTDKQNTGEMKPAKAGSGRTRDRASLRKSEKLRITSLTAMIVIVILIIAAILTGAGLHDAREAEDRQVRAENFAEKILNTLQSRGRDRIREQFWNGYTYTDKKGSLTFYEGAPFSLVNNYGSMGPADENFRIYGKEDGVKLPENGEVQRYAILGTEYKGSEYDVQIVYDPSGYGDASGSDVHAYNINNFPDIETLTGENTAILNPEGAYVRFPTNADGSYEYDDVTQQFRSEAITLESSALDSIYVKRSTFYEEAVAMINATITYETEIHNWHKLTGTSYYDSSDKSSKIPELKKKIARSTVILAEGWGGDVRVTSSVLFQLTDKSFVGNPQVLIEALPGIFDGATVTVEKENIVVAEDGTEIVEKVLVEEPVPQETLDPLIETLTEKIEDLYEQSTSEEALTEQFMVYETDHPFSNLENIYLMYYPLRNNEWQSDTICIDISEIRSLYEKDRKLNLYVVPQLGLLASDKNAYKTIQASDYIAPKLSGGTISFDHSSQTASVKSKGTLFDMARIRVNYIKGYMRTLAAADMNASIMESADPEDILYNLQVKVFEGSGGGFAGSDYITGSTVTSS